MTIKELADEKTIGEMKAEDLAERRTDFVAKLKTNEDIEKASRNEQEQGIIRDFILKKKVVQTVEAAEDTVAEVLNPAKHCAIIAMNAAGAIEDEIKGFRTVTENDAFVDKMAAGVVETETKLSDVIKATGNRMAMVVDTKDLEPGMIIVLSATGDEGKTHVITIKDVTRDKSGKVTDVTYVANIKEKEGVIEATVSIADLMKGVSFKENKDGDLVSGNEFEWKGVVLASKQAMKKEGIISVRQLQDIFRLDKEAAEKVGVEGMMMLATIVKGITAPDKRSAEVKAIAGMLGKESVSGIKAEDLYKLFGIEKGAGRKAIMDAILTRMDMLSKQGSGAEVELSVELTAVAGGLLLAMENQEVSTILGLKENKINGNQGTITRLLKERYKTGYAKAGSDNFIIDIEKLQKAATDKKVYTAEQRGKILDALANDSLKWQKNERTIAGLFTLQNVRAIAAAA
jgi:hypothetical protein